MSNSFHITWEGLCEPYWPRGSCRANKVGACWCGYIGMFETLPEAMDAIEAAKKKAT